ncbi:MAG: PHP domain-containing protein [Clostridia bacterium]|nr:PHP domain-containing protein [Clostridia bacterium]
MIDLHMHTVYSDGDKTVAEILKMCEERKLEYISITDHDTCKQYDDEALKNNKIFSGKIIKGSELHAVFQNRNIEILAYNIDTNIINNWCQKYYSSEKLKKQQTICYQRLLDICNNHGLIYNESKIRKPKTESEYIERAIYEEVIAHSENHKILGEFANSFGLFFRKGLANPESSYFMNHVEFRPKYKEVIEIIHKAGGKAFLAHPFEYKFENTIKFIDDLRKEIELDGIECFHPSSVNDDKKDILVEYARKNNLYISGGSDYHGEPKPDIQIGIGRGNLNISKEIVQEWLIVK